jgi:adenosylmethionine-8-amino-7-oxononanoate aminotransferase
VSEKSFVHAENSAVLHREFDRPYPLIESAQGLWLTDENGTRLLDAVSGGAMVTGLGHGVPEINEALQAQAAKVSFLYNQQFTSRAQEQLAEELVELAPDGFSRVHFVTGGAEGNETAIRLARHYHLDRGDEQRWRIISPAQAYHGPTMATFSLAGRPGMTSPYGPYLTNHLHIPPATWRFDPTGQAALDALDACIEEAGPETISAYYCEPVHAASLPGYRYPDLFFEGLRERADRHGFLICFDEVVTGIGRTGKWFAANHLPIDPDIITLAKGLGAGFMPVGAVLCRDSVYAPLEENSRSFEAGHTWDGVPVSCAVGLAVLDYIRSHDLIERSAAQGAKLLAGLQDALAGSDIVREVRGVGLLLGIEYVDPRDGESFLPTELRTARRIDEAALENELLVYSTQPTSDGYVGDQTLMAPAFVISDEEVDQVVTRFADSVATVERHVKNSLKPTPAPLG